MSKKEKFPGSATRDKFKIRVAPDGPYIVTGSVPLSVQTIVLDAEGQSLSWREIKTYSPLPVYFLCRCGKSQFLPFCDWTHANTGFNGKETASRNAYLDQCDKYSGPALDLTDSRPLCIHAGFCDRASGIWKLVQRSDDPQAREIAIEEAYNCPSGRLVVWDKTGKALEPRIEPSIVIIVKPDGSTAGPLWVRGGIPVISSDGKAYEIRNRVTLCGCGRSLNKPFCDGSHRNIAKS